MSVTHPHLKELKRYATKLITECPKPIKDNEVTLQHFCDCFEKILVRGLIPVKTVVGLLAPQECWSWLKKLAEEKWGIPYAYATSVEYVENNSRVETNRGRTRLLIRTCLVKRCLHSPVQYLVNEDRCCLLYQSNTILGDSILASVLTSLLLCLSTITFELDLENAAFLDSTWQLPLVASLTFVPTHSLGLCIMFVEGKALIAEIVPNSIADESVDIEVGDIVDSVNGTVIDKKSQGSLSKILRKSPLSPVSLRLIKAVKEKKIYPPILNYWQQAGLDPAVISKSSGVICSPLKTDDISRIVYFGSVSTGEHGDIKQIHLAIQNLSPDRNPTPVSIDCHSLGLRVVCLNTNKVLVEHTYMEISTCGTTTTASPFFAFIAGDTNFTQCRNFTCYIFQSRDSQLVSSLLDTIGQGFKRTLYTV